MDSTRKFVLECLPPTNPLLCFGLEDLSQCHIVTTYKVEPQKVNYNYCNYSHLHLVSKLGSKSTCGCSCHQCTFSLLTSPKQSQRRIVVMCAHTFNALCKVKASIGDHVHLTTHQGTCNADMDEIYIFRQTELSLCGGNL